MKRILTKTILRKLTPVLSILLSVAVLGTTVFLARLKLSATIRARIVNRDAEILYSAVCLLRDSLQEEALNINDPADQLTLILKASNLRGVIAVRLFDSDGKFIAALPAHVKESELSEQELSFAKSVKPISNFYPYYNLKDLFYYLPDSLKDYKQQLPILVVTVPLHRKDEIKISAIAQFLIEGTSVANEFAVLERNLNLQALVAFGVGTLLIVFGLGYAFHKLEKRTEDLRKANLELAMAARTSAVGAVAAHLIHGLKSPLAGLQLLANGKPANGSDSDLDWENAVKSINRIKSMINEVANLLKEETGSAEYEITLEELSELVLNKTARLAKEKNVNLNVETNGKTTLSNRAGNLVALILVNLLENGISATPEGKSVALKINADKDKIIFSVTDEGAGLPENVMKNLFLPCHSTKPGGSGIGLAISKQLANHLGASLILKYTGSTGSCFELILPINASKTKADFV